MKKTILSLSLVLLTAVNAFATEPKSQNKNTISFTENKGQVHDQNFKPRTDVLYGAMTGNVAVHIKKTGVSYQLHSVDSYKEVLDEKNMQNKQQVDQQTVYRIDLNWLNCNSNVSTSQDQALPGYNNYYLQSCPQGALKVKSYEGVTLNNIYPGINLHYYEKAGELKHDYIVSAHVDYHSIQLKVEGAQISVNKDGSLLLNTPLGAVQEGAPIVYQHGKQLNAKWINKNNTLSFEIENYNPNYELVIDPVTRMWGTYYGGSSSDLAYSSTTDLNNNVYMTGVTASSTIMATSGSHQSSFAGGVYADAFLVKFNSNGVRLWGTYYGGTDDDHSYSCSTDLSGNIYIAGYTNSDTTSVIANSTSHQNTYGGGSYDAFLAKFDGSGIRQWGTYYGGTGNDRGYSCSVDSNGDVYLSGSTTSNSLISTSGSYQVNNNGNGDNFLVKFNGLGTRQWATYYGGSSIEDLGNCATDNFGNVYLTAVTSSTNNNQITTLGSHQPTIGGGISDAYLVKFNSSGTRQWATYYGGANSDGGSLCSTDPSGDVYITGYTSTNSGTTIATLGSHQPAFGGGSNLDAFLAKFSANGVRQWGSYYGGSGYEYGYSCATDAAGNVYLTGETTSSSGTIIATSVGYQSSNGGGSDAFLVKFNNSGIRQWATYYGGSSGETGFNCTVDQVGNIYLNGITSSNSGTVIATSSSHQNIYGGGGQDAFLVKFDVCEVAASQPSVINGSTVVCAGSITSYSTPLAYGANSYTWLISSGNLSAGNSNTIVLTPLSSGIFTLIAGNACGLSTQQTLSITVNPLPTVTINNGNICAGESFTLNAGGANSYTYSSGSVITPNLTSSYTVSGTNSFGCVSSTISSVIVNPLPIISVNSGAICIGQSFTLSAGGANTYTYSTGPVVAPTTTSTYSVSGTSAAGCVSSSPAISTVSVSNVYPVVTVNSGTICSGKSFTVVPGGASTYTIQGGNFIVSPTSSSSYTVVGTSTAGCVSSNTAVSTVAVNALPTLSLSSNVDFLCVGESATLTASGASNYTFNPGGVGANVTVSPVATTQYNVIGIDANGCSNTAVITQNVSECTGVKNAESSQHNFKVYPNPSSGIFNLELESESTIIIFDGLGRIVQSSSVNPGINQINLQGFASGVYVLKLNESAKRIKLVKE